MQLHQLFCNSFKLLLQQSFVGLSKLFLYLIFFTSLLKCVATFRTFPLDAQCTQHNSLLLLGTPLVGGVNRKLLILKYKDQKAQNNASCTSFKIGFFLKIVINIY